MCLCCAAPLLPSNQLTAHCCPLQLRGRLAAEVRACWGDLPDWLGREAAKGVPADGAVHPVCATTMALLKRTLAYESALPVLFGEGAAAGGAGAGVRGGGGLAEEAGRIDRMAAATAHILDKLLAGECRQQWGWHGSVACRGWAPAGRGGNGGLLLVRWRSACSNRAPRPLQAAAHL